ncbi:MAG: dihydroxy-acid dehydratase, partial [Bryobacterales bacterium]|nr:dihydroxy-acid dehydratase [Bryobacterales bacterium]
IDLKARRVDMQVSEDEIARRRAALKIEMPESQTPWQELFRAHVSQQETGAVFDFAVKYRNVGKEIPRHSH